MHSAQCLVDLPVALVTVLHLVNHHVVHLPLPLQSDVGELLKDVQSEIYEVFKV